MQKTAKVCSDNSDNSKIDIAGNCHFSATFLQISDTPLVVPHFHRADVKEKK